MKYHWKHYCAKCNNTFISNDMEIYCVFCENEIITLYDYVPVEVVENHIKVEDQQEYLNSLFSLLIGKNE